MTKDEQIIEIKRILRECCEGSISTCDLQAESSPCISSTGTNKTNVSVLAEVFGDDVEISTYVGELEIATGNVDYEDLSEDVIDEIYNLFEQYEVGLDKTLKRCQN